MAESITGDKALDRKLRQLRDKMQTKIKKAAVKSALLIGAKHIKKEVPSRFKNVRKSVGVRVGKDKQYVLGAKVGFRVGRKASKESKAAAVAARGAGKGVGISGQNFHWWILGAGYKVGGVRQWKEGGKSTGAMPVQDGEIVPRGWAAAQPKVLAKMAESLKRGIEREAAKT